MSTFFGTLAGQKPLRMQLDPGQSPIGADTAIPYGYLNEWRVFGDGAGGYGLPVVSREDQITDLRTPQLAPTCLSGYETGQCKIFYNINVISPQTGDLITSFTPYTARWCAPSQKHAWVVGQGGGVRLSAASDGDYEWSATLQWEEI